MPLPEESTLLRIFIGEADEVHGRPLYEDRRVHLRGASARLYIQGFAP